MDRRKFLSASAAVSVGASLPGCMSVENRDITKKNQELTGSFRIAELASKPPLGWNSFNSYGVYLHYDAAMANLEAFSEKLKPSGYEYFVIDLGWYGEYKLIPGTLYPDEKHASDVAIDEYGLLEPSRTYFSRGLKPIIDRAHDLGIKIGLHMMRGIPRKAVDQDTPIKGSAYTAAQIADITSTCPWCHHNYGIDVSKPGAQDYYNAAYKKLADWEIDFVKVDDLIPYPDELLMIAEAIENSGRKMIYSLSPGGDTTLRDLPYYRRANMLRVTHDIWDRKKDFSSAFDRWRQYQGMGTPGFWPDLDMIPFGNLQTMQPKEYGGKERDVRLSGYGFSRKCQLNEDEMQTFITQRALAASPLMMGGDLPTLDDYSLQLLTNGEMLACNQNGQTGVLVYENDGIEVWLAAHTGIYGSGWFGVFNRNEATMKVNLTPDDLQLGIPPDMEGKNIDFALKDIWNQTQIPANGKGFEFNTPANGVVFVKYETL